MRLYRLMFVLVAGAMLSLALRVAGQCYNPYNCIGYTATVPCEGGCTDEEYQVPCSYPWDSLMISRYQEAAIGGWFVCQPAPSRIDFHCEMQPKVCAWYVLRTVEADPENCSDDNMCQDWGILNIYRGEAKFGYGCATCPL